MFYRFFSMPARRLVKARCILILPRRVLIKIHRVAIILSLSLIASRCILITLRDDLRMVAPGRRRRAASCSYFSAVWASRGTAWSWRGGYAQNASCFDRSARRLDQNSSRRSHAFMQRARAARRFDRAARRLDQNSPRCSHAFPLFDPAAVGGDCGGKNRGAKKKQLTLFLALSDCMTMNLHRERSGESSNDVAL